MKFATRERIIDANLIENDLIESNYEYNIMENTEILCKTCGEDPCVCDVEIEDEDDDLEVKDIDL